MKLKLLVTALAWVVSATVHATPSGDSSNETTVETILPSTVLPFGAGKAALRINKGVIRINIGNGPVKYINKVHTNKPINGNNYNVSVNGKTNPKYLTPAIVPLGNLIPIPSLRDVKIGQTWYEKRGTNIDVYSVRRMAKAGTLPEFGGLVIGQVKNLPDGSGVYFGEWAPRKGGTVPDNDTNLNMADARRTVWYAGDNPTGRTQGLATATYDVVGINKHTPGANDFYRGTVTAKFGTTTQGTMGGQIARGADRISFDKAKIDNTKGTFADTAQGMKGQFYGKDAAAMAGIATRKAGAADDVAFGGRKR